MCCFSLLLRKVCMCFVVLCFLQSFYATWRWRVRALMGQKPTGEQHFLMKSISYMSHTNDMHIVCISNSKQTIACQSESVRLSVSSSSTSFHSFFLACFEMMSKKILRPIKIYLDFYENKWMLLLLTLTVWYGVLLCALYL